MIKLKNGQDENKDKVLQKLIKSHSIDPRKLVRGRVEHNIRSNKKMAVDVEMLRDCVLVDEQIPNANVMSISKDLESKPEIIANTK